ncbi:hypothetical protein D9M71_424360 [compost metagenome]
MPAGQGGDPAQRHPPGHRRRRADAPAGGPAPAGLEPRLGADRGDPGLHQPHPAAGGPGVLAGFPDGAPVAAAPADHLPDQRPAHRRPARQGHPRFRPAAGGVADRGRPRPACPHGQPGVSRRPQHQWRVGAAYPADAGNRVPRPAQALPAAGEQQDQWRDLPPLAVPDQSAADPPAGGNPGRSGAGLPGKHPGSARTFRREAGLSQAVRPAPPAQQAGAGPPGAPAPGHRPGYRGHLRRAGQAHPRVQAPAAQPAADRGAVPGHPQRPGHRLGATGEDLRRQGCRQLLPGQADHQAGQRHQPDHQRRPHGARAAQGGVHSQLQRQPG